MHRTNEPMLTGTIHTTLVLAERKPTRTRPNPSLIFLPTPVKFHVIGVLRNQMRYTSNSPFSLNERIHQLLFSSLLLTVFKISLFIAGHVLCKQIHYDDDYDFYALGSKALKG